MSKCFTNLEDALLQALENYHSEDSDNSTSDLKLIGIEFEPFPVTGENYASDIEQRDVDYELNGNRKHKSFIIKSLRPDMIELGSNEEIMLSKALPAMENILKTAEIANNKLHAKCFFHMRREKEEEFYLLENLNSLGYYCADRTKGLNFQQSLVVMSKIAKFHAASMLYVKEYTDILKSMFEASHFEKGASDPLSESITYGGFEYVANMSENWPSFKGLSDKLRSLIPKFNNAIQKMTDSKISKFNVINHGDLWVNNFLLKHDEDTENCIDAIFVDFQNCFWGSCGFDINYFLNTSLKVKYLKTQRQELIKAYYDSLCETLAQIKYPANEIPSQQDVLDEVKRCELFGLYASVCEFPIVTMERSLSKTFDFKIFTEPEEIKRMRVLLYNNNRRVTENLEYTLKYFEEINVL